MYILQKLTHKEIIVKQRFVDDFSLSFRPGFAFPGVLG